MSRDPVPASEPASEPGPEPGRRSGSGSDERELRERYVGDRDLTRWDTPLGRIVARTATALWHGVVRSAGWAGARWALVLTVVVGVGLAVLATAGTAEINEAVTEGDGIAEVDGPLLDAVVAARTPGLTRAVQLYTEVGGPQGMPALALVAVVAMTIAWRSRTPAVLVVVTAAGSLLMTVVGKAAVGRARPALSEAIPPFESSYSFPSGHSLNAMAISGIVAYLVVLHLRRKRARVAVVVVAAVFATTMGLSRVYLGHHWLTDVVAAWALALGWLAVVITGHRLWLTVRTTAPAASPSDGPDGG